MSLTPPSIGKYRLAYQARPWRGPWASSAGCPCRGGWPAGIATSPAQRPPQTTSQRSRRTAASAGRARRPARMATAAPHSAPWLPDRCVQPSRRRSGLPLVGGHGRRRGAAVPAVGGPGATEQSTDHDEPQGLQQPELDHDPEASVHQRSLPYWLPRYGSARPPSGGQPEPAPAPHAWRSHPAARGRPALPGRAGVGSGTRPDHHPTFEQHDRQLSASF
jgi:hypothetical protein